jgi:hypothetical protein
MARCRAVASTPLSRLAPGAPSAVVLVEGVSDQLAVEALAARRGRDLNAEGVAVVAIGGAGNIRRFVDLIRCLGSARVERIIDAEGELGRFRTFQNQPAQRARSIEAQLRRFMGTRGGRKIQYAPVLAGALDLDRVPQPLDGVLAHVQ